MDSSYQAAAADIRDIQLHPLTEPFVCLKRRTNNFRESKEYREWQDDLRQWQRRYAHLLRSGL